MLPIDKGAAAPGPAEGLGAKPGFFPVRRGDVLAYSSRATASATRSSATRRPSPRTSATDT